MHDDETKIFSQGTMQKIAERMDEEYGRRTLDEVDLRIDDRRYAPQAFREVAAEALATLKHEGGFTLCVEYYGETEEYVVLTPVTPMSASCDDIPGLLRRLADAVEYVQK